ncbi:hypothetical protein V495_07539 [Pseudogymnoascus sp. VKM F-4514 (FW-929)]|nr:hypothetical protein V495_07539 [Pseudogymnoascus sp. VKM F-4514 (FW-929)]KFY64596.1 hypothetical protein V497_01644 [Pseudogymnoascus sp. VKM F-4516 (FW-969)]
MASAGEGDKTTAPEIKIPSVNRGPTTFASLSLPFSAFTPLEKRLITFSASFAAMFSGLSSFIYYPIIVPLSTSLSVSVELINLTLTSYLLVAAIAPSIVGDVADHSGRRPIYLITFLIYFAANLGLAMQRNYIALLLLRMMQSLGSSGWEPFLPGTITIVYGVIADVATADERGSYVGTLMGFTNAAPCFGPIIGGVLSQYAGWPWVFWFLAILSGSVLVGMFVFFPETAREVVGDGSIPVRGIRKTFYAMIRDKVSSHSEANQHAKVQVKFRAPNPLSCLLVLCDLNSLLIMTVGSIYYAIFSVLATSLSTTLLTKYHLSYLTTGLVYLPSGVGGVIAALFTGKSPNAQNQTTRGSWIIGRLLDIDYQVEDRRLNAPATHETRAEKLMRFPIEKIRLQRLWYFIAINITAMIGYGWALEARTHLSVPLILQFFTGSTMIAIFTICGTLLTDLNAERSATAQAAYNITRCFASAGLIATLQPITDATGPGWCFCIYASLCALGALLAWLLQMRGMDWRTKRRNQSTVGRSEA